MTNLHLYNKRFSENNAHVAEEKIISKFHFTYLIIVMIIGV